MKIFKYELNGLAGQEVMIPKGAKILSAGVQHGKIQIWALVEPTNKLEAREFSVFGTGWPVNIKENFLQFIQTVFDGGLVWHVFEIREDENV